MVASSSSLWLLLLFLSLLSASSSSPKIWNIDCGATEIWVEEDTNLTWAGDSDYVKSGESHEVANTTGGAKRLTTLRAFPQYRKNCYSVPVGAKTKIKVWVSFYYGNYDGLATPPTFELLLDDNNWDTVNTELDSPVNYRIIYTAERNFTDICVARTNDDQTPFVSSIQVVALEPGMYSEVNSTVSLYALHQRAFGANVSFRSPYDSYDRVWHLTEENNIGISTNNTLYNNATAVKTSLCPDNPPSKLFDAAITPSKGSRNITITTTYLSNIPNGIYLNMYFTETNASLSRKRLFDIYMDDKLISDAPISPRFGEALEFSYVESEKKVYNATKIILVPANNSILPPIISGFETLRMWPFSSDATNADDARVVLKLQSKFEALKNWSGDPCLPNEYNWEWINCNDARAPRVVKLSLGGYGLSGRFPDFSDLDALVVIDLQNNSLYGSIPDFLGELPNLRELNLAYNNFSSIPPSLSANKRISLKITGNPLLDPKLATDSESRPPNGSEKNTTPILILWILLMVWITMA